MITALSSFLYNEESNFTPILVACTTIVSVALFFKHCYLGHQNHQAAPLSLKQGAGSSDAPSVAQKNSSVETSLEPRLATLQNVGIEADNLKNDIRSIWGKTKKFTDHITPDVLKKKNASDEFFGKISSQACKKLFRADANSFSSPFSDYIVDLDDRITPTKLALEVGEYTKTLHEILRHLAETILYTTSDKKTELNKQVCDLAKEMKTVMDESHKGDTD